MENLIHSPHLPIFNCLICFKDSTTLQYQDNSYSLRKHFNLVYEVLPSLVTYFLDSMTLFIGRGCAHTIKKHTSPLLDT